MGPPCDVVVGDCFTIFIEQLPTVDAGEDQTILESETAILYATAENYSSLIWSSGGDGAFNDATILNPVYTPGAQDISSGSAELCFVAPCEVH